MSFLSEMAAASKARLETQIQRVSEKDMAEQALSAPTPPSLSLSRFDVIAELKHRSPAAGDLSHEGFSTSQQLTAYQQAGATAISVLTEPTAFKGDLSHLSDAVKHLGTVPIMRKDFLVAPYQVYEARVAGAAGVLVILGILDDRAAKGLLETADELGLFTLTEAFDEQELDRGVGLLDSLRLKHPALLGVNCRNLKTLKIDFQRFEAFAARLPTHIPVIAESGLTGPEDATRVAELGFRGALVGSALMSTNDPQAALRNMISAGRKVNSR